MDGSPIHTIPLFHHWAFHYWKKFRLLRVVDAISVTFTSYPHEITKLFHLRHLVVAFGSGMKTGQFEVHESAGQFEVHESLSKLQNLQMLITRQISFLGSGDTAYLPFGIWRMPQLRHLILLDGFLPNPSIEAWSQILVLENFHTLKQVKSFTCSERILKSIPNLKKLGMIYSFSDIYNTGSSTFGLKNLVHLHKLKKFNFHADPHDYSHSYWSQNLAFPVTLNKLTLSGSGIPWEDMSVVGSLPNLEVLKLKRHACHGFEWETTKGEFSQLKEVLTISTDPHHWITESSHFPRLERLLLYNCHSLREIPSSIGEIPTLQLTEVDLCNLSIVESAKLIEEEQHCFGNDLQIHFRTSSNWNLDGST